MRTSPPTRYYYYALIAAIFYTAQVKASAQLCPSCGFHERYSFGSFYPEFSHYVLIEPWPKCTPCHLQCFYPNFQQRLYPADNADCNSASRLLCPLKSNDNPYCMPSSVAVNSCRPAAVQCSAIRRKSLVKRTPPVAIAEKPTQRSLYVPDQNCNRLARHCANTCFYNYDTVKCNNEIPVTSPPYLCNGWADNIICNDPSNYSSYLPRQGIKYILVNRLDRQTIPPSLTKSNNHSVNPRFRTIV